MVIGLNDENMYAPLEGTEGLSSKESGHGVRCSEVDLGVLGTMNVFHFRIRMVDGIYGRYCNFMGG